VSDDPLERLPVVPSGIVDPPGLLYARRHPMDAWLVRERARLRQRPADEREIRLPGVWASRCDAKGGADE
jgi:hypothetical protein